MKKLILIAVVLVSIISCSTSNSNETEDSIIPENLIGSWQYVGYFTPYDISQTPGANFYPIANGGITNYYSNASFDHTVENKTFSGNFSVSSNSILTFKELFSSIGAPQTNKVKIVTLTENVLELSCVNANGFEACDIQRYEKIVTP